MLSAVLLAAMLAATPQVSSRTNAVVFGPQPMTVSAQSVTPATITFTAPDPDTNATVAGSASASLKFTLAMGKTAWSVAVSSPGFTNCATVPVSAVTATATCTTTSGTSSCSNGALSAAGTTIASGTKANPASAFTITIAFTLADSWTYIASSSCSLALTYSITG
jgi:hypothetical protein